MSFKRVSQSVVLGPMALASAGRLLDVQDLEAHPRSAEKNVHVIKLPR